MITGERSQQVALELSNIPVKVTRLDIAVTAWFTEPRPMAMGEIWKTVRERQEQGRVKYASHIVNTDKGETIYVGKRGERMMLRIYDKGVMWGKPPGEVIRWELEVKKAPAKLAFASFCAAGNKTEYLSSLMSGWLSQKFIPGPGAIGRVHKYLAVSISVESDEGQLHFIRRVVSPHLQKLLRAGIIEELNLTLFPLGDYEIRSVENGSE